MALLRRNAAVLDELDVACSSAILAVERNLVKPVLHAGYVDYLFMSEDLPLIVYQ